MNINSYYGIMSQRDTKTDLIINVGHSDLYLSSVIFAPYLKEFVFKMNGILWNYDSGLFND